MNRKWIFIITGLIFFTGLAVYLKTFWYGFVFDDFEFIVTNPFIKNFSEMDGFWRLGFPKTRLVTLYSFAANYFVNGLNPAGYHIFNFLMHILTSFCVWHLAQILFHWPQLTLFNKKSSNGYPDHKSILAVFVVLLFVTHPGNSQAITYITQRFSIITTFFYFLSIIFYLHGRAKYEFKFKNIFLFLLSFLSAIAAIMSKEEAISLPIMILFIELFLFSKELKKEEVIKESLKNKKPSNNAGKTSAKPFQFRGYIIAGLAMVFFSFFLWLFRGNIFDYLSWTGQSESHDGDALNTITYLLTQIRVFMTFIRLLILPIGQTLEYDFPMSHSFFEMPVLVNFVLTALMAYGFFKFSKTNKLISFGIAWLFITFTANLFPRVNVIFEHKLYLICFGFCILLVSLIDRLVKNPRLKYSILSVWVLCLAVTTFIRNDVWSSELKLWQDVVSKAPNKARPNANMGKVYLERREYEKALKYLDHAIELNPKDNRAITNRGSVYFALRIYDKALENYNQAMSVDPGYFGSYINRGLVYMETGDLEKAMQDFNHAVDLDPKFQYAYVKRGHLLRQVGKFKEALDEFNKALSIDNVDVEALIGRAIVYFDLKEDAKAIVDFNKAIALSPGNGKLFLDRGFFYLQRNNINQALSDFNAAIKFDPRNPEAFTKRGMALKATGQTQAAMDDFDKALTLDPNHIVARNNRMAILFERNDMARAMEDCNKVIEIAPYLDYAYKNRGMIMQSVGKLDNAIEDFTTALEKNPANSEAFFLRGSAYFMQQKLDKALSDFSQVLTLQADNFAAYNNRGVIRSTLQEYEAAMEDFDKAIGLAPKYSAPYWGKALAFAATEKYKDAVGMAEQAIALGHPVDNLKIKEWQQKIK